MAGSSCNHVWLLRWIPFWMGSYPLTRAACSLNMSREGNLFANEADVVSCFSFCNTKYKLRYILGGFERNHASTKTNITWLLFSWCAVSYLSHSQYTRAFISILLIICNCFPLNLLCRPGRGTYYKFVLCICVCCAKSVWLCFVCVCCAYFCCLFAFVLAWVRYEWMYHTLRLCLNVFR